MQTFTDHKAHSYFADPVYPALFAALRKWVEAGEKPTPAGIARDCKALESQYGAPCGFVPDYEVRPLESRVPRR